MQRPLQSIRPLGPFIEFSNSDTLEPDKYLIFEFEDEQWMIEDREKHKFDIQRELRQPRGPTGDVIVRIKEKKWDGRTLVKEYEDEFPVSMLQIGMLDVIDFEEARSDVVDIVAEYVHDQGGEYDRVAIQTVS